MKKIVGWVLFVHLAALTWMSLSFSSKMQKKPIVVKTVTLAPAPLHTNTVSAPVKQQPSMEKKASLQPEVPQPIKKPPTKKPAPKNTVKKPAAKPVEKKKVSTPPSKVQSLLSSLEESLEKIEQPKVRKKMAETPDLSNKKRRLKIDDLDSSSAIGYSDNYQDQLIDLLKEGLDLPDYGEVKLKLTLKKDGTMMELIILESHSQKNRNYLEENLKRVRFPVFPGGMAKENTHTFTITFCNQL